MLVVLQQNIEVEQNCWVVGQQPNNRMLVCEPWMLAEHFSWEIADMVYMSGVRPNKSSFPVGS